MLNNETLSPSRQLFRLVRPAKAKASSAEHAFESANRSIQRDTETTKLTRDYALSRTADIVRDANQTARRKVGIDSPPDFNYNIR